MNDIKDVNNETLLQLGSAVYKLLSNGYFDHPDNDEHRENEKLIVAEIKQRSIVFDANSAAAYMGVIPRRVRALALFHNVGEKVDGRGKWKFTIDDIIKMRPGPVGRPPVKDSNDG